MLMKHASEKKLVVIIPPSAKRMTVDAAACRKPECGSRCEKD